MNNIVDPAKRIFELLENTSDATVKVVFQMFSQVGPGWPSEGYFFAKTSADLINEAMRCDVLDSNDNIVGTILEHDLLALGEFVLQMDPAPDREARFHLAAPKIPVEDKATLWEIRSLILQDIKSRGGDAADLYALIGTDPDGAKARVFALTKDLNT